MKKREADFGVLFRHWLKVHKMHNAAFELKQTTSDRLPFSSLAEHQIIGLLAAKNDSGILYKAPDDSRSVKPFDYFYLRNALAFVVIRYPKTAEIIDIEAFIMERDRTIAKSLTSERAKAISTISIKLSTDRHLTHNGTVIL